MFANILLCVLISTYPSLNAGHVGKGAPLRPGGGGNVHVGGGVHPAGNLGGGGHKVVIGGGGGGQGGHPPGVKVTGGGGGGGHLQGGGHGGGPGNIGVRSHQPIQVSHGGNIGARMGAGGAAEGKRKGLLGLGHRIQHYNVQRGGVRWRTGPKLRLTNHTKIKYRIVRRPTIYRKITRRIWVRKNKAGVGGAVDVSVAGGAATNEEITFNVYEEKIYNFCTKYLCEGKDEKVCSADCYDWIIVFGEEANKLLIIFDESFKFSQFWTIIINFFSGYTNEDDKSILNITIANEVQENLLCKDVQSEKPETNEDVLRNYCKANLCKDAVGCSGKCDKMIGTLKTASAEAAKKESEFFDRAAVDTKITELTSESSEQAKADYKALLIGEFCRKLRANLALNETEKEALNKEDSEAKQAEAAVDAAGADVDTGAATNIGARTITIKGPQAKTNKQVTINIVGGGGRNVAARKGVIVKPGQKGVFIKGQGGRRVVVKGQRRVIARRPIGGVQTGGMRNAGGGFQWHKRRTYVKKNYKPAHLNIINHINRKKIRPTVTIRTKKRRIFFLNPKVPQVKGKEVYEARDVELTENENSIYDSCTKNSCAGKDEKQCDAHCNEIVNKTNEDIDVLIKQYYEAWNNPKLDEDIKSEVASLPEDEQQLLNLTVTNKIKKSYCKEESTGNKKIVESYCKDQICTKLKPTDCDDKCKKLLKQYEDTVEKVLKKESDHFDKKTFEIKLAAAENKDNKAVLKSEFCKKLIQDVDDEEKSVTITTETNVTDIETVNVTENVYEDIYVNGTGGEVNTTEVITEIIVGNGTEIISEEVVTGSIDVNSEEVTRSAVDSAEQTTPGDATGTPAEGTEVTTGKGDKTHDSGKAISRTISDMITGGHSKTESSSHAPGDEHTTEHHEGTTEPHTGTHDGSTHEPDHTTEKIAGRSPGAGGAATTTHEPDHSTEHTTDNIGTKILAEHGTTHDPDHTTEQTTAKIGGRSLGAHGVTTHEPDHSTDHTTDISGKSLAEHGTTHDPEHTTEQTTAKIGEGSLGEHGTTHEPTHESGFQSLTIGGDVGKTVKTIKTVKTVTTSHTTSSDSKIGVRTLSGKGADKGPKNELDEHLESTGSDKPCKSEFDETLHEAKEIVENKIPEIEQQAKKLTESASHLKFKFTHLFEKLKKLRNISCCDDKKHSGEGDHELDHKGDKHSGRSIPSKPTIQLQSETTTHHEDHTGESSTHGPEQSTVAGRAITTTESSHAETSTHTSTGDGSTHDAEHSTVAGRAITSDVTGAETTTHASTGDGSSTHHADQTTEVTTAAETTTTAKSLLEETVASG